MDKLRFIPYELSKKLDNGDDKLGQDILDFVMEDLEKHGNNENKRHKYANFSQFVEISKINETNYEKLWNQLQNDYATPKLVNKKRVVLSTLFNNASLSNYNVDNMISSNPAGVKGLLDTIINNPVNNNDEICYQIAKNEVDTLCNILKDKNNYKALTRGNIIDPAKLNKIETLYNTLDPQLGELLRPLVLRIKEADKAKKEKDEVKEDERKLNDLDKRVGDNFENHRMALLGYATMNRPGKLSDDRWGNMPARKDDDRPIPGKLKPFKGPEKDEARNERIPGKLKPFGGKDRDEAKNEKIPGRLKPSGGKDKDDIFNKKG